MKLSVKKAADCPFRDEFALVNESSSYEHEKPSEVKSIVFYSLYNWMELRQCRFNYMNLVFESKFSDFKDQI